MSEPASAVSSGAILPGSTLWRPSSHRFWTRRCRARVALANPPRCRAGKSRPRLSREDAVPARAKPDRARNLSGAPWAPASARCCFARQRHQRAARELDRVRRIRALSSWRPRNRREWWSPSPTSEIGSCSGGPRARRGVRLSLIGRRLRGFFNRKLVAARVESGMKQLADRGSSSEALQLLRGGAVLAIAVDQKHARAPRESSSTFRPPGLHHARRGRLCAAGRRADHRGLSGSRPERAPSRAGEGSLRSAGESART